MHLLQRVERYLRKSGTAATTFGRVALGDPRFVFDLRKGREPRRQVMRRVTAFLDAREAELGR